MARDGGFISVEFTGERQELVKINDFIQKTIREQDVDDSEVSALTFLVDYDPERFEIDSELVCFDTIDDSKTFFKEFVKAFPKIGFSGTISHSWLFTNGSETNVQFSHNINTPNLEWDVTYEGYNEDEGDED